MAGPDTPFVQPVTSTPARYVAEQAALLMERTAEWDIEGAALELMAHGELLAWFQPEFAAEVPELAVGVQWRAEPECPLDAVAVQLGSFFRWVVVAPPDVPESELEVYLALRSGSERLSPEAARLAAHAALLATEPA